MEFRVHLPLIDFGKGSLTLDQLLARVPDCGMRQVDVSPRDRVRYRSSSDTT